MGDLPSISHSIAFDFGDLRMVLFLLTDSSVSAFRLIFYPGMTSSTNFKPNMAFTWAEYELKSEAMQDFQTGDIWHFTGTSQILLVLSDAPTHIVKTVKLF